MTTVRRKVTAITMTFDDGSTMTRAIDGYYLDKINYHKGAKLPEEGFHEHSVNWRSDD